MATEKMTVAVLGGGNGAFAHAAHLSLNGFRVNMYEVPEFSESVAQVQERGGIELRPERLPDFPHGFARLNLVSTEPGEVLAGAELVWLVVPAFAQRRFAQACAPHFTSEQIVVLTPGNGGALEFVNVLRDEGVRNLPQIVEAESMIYSCMKAGASEIVIDGFKKGMAVAALPGTETPHVLSRLHACFPSLRPMTSVLETQLSNVNLVVHGPIMLLNAGRIDSEQGFEFYREGATRWVGTILEAVDRERLRVANGLGLVLSPLLAWQLRVYGHQGARGTSLAEVLASNPAYAGFAAPRTMCHRFIIEDIPFGMVAVERFGELASVPTPIISSLINIASEMLNVDLRMEGRDWEELGIAGLTVDELKEYVGHWDGARQVA
jgi:opine dehydrogenase